MQVHITIVRPYQFMLPVFTYHNLHSIAPTFSYQAKVSLSSKNFSRYVWSLIGAYDRIWCHVYTEVTGISLHTRHYEESTKPKRMQMSWDVPVMELERRLCNEENRFINEIKAQFVVITMCRQHHVKHGEEFSSRPQWDARKRSSSIVARSESMKSN